MKFRGEILALLRLAGVLQLAAMEPEFNPLSPEKKLGTTINTRYRGAGVFISFIIRDPLLAWRITG